MKWVAKGASPPSFDAWKAQASEAWQPAYEALQNPEKQHLHAALLTEQGGVCCYCGRGITLTDSHIEHFRPQSAYPDLALDFTNLFASCLRQTEPGVPLHCGHAKGKDFDADKAISPLDEECERRFMYSAHDGAIYPADSADESAAYMTALLRLDLAFLRVRRAEALTRVFDDAFVNTVNPDELATLVEAFRHPDGSGRMASFGHVLARYAEQLLEDKAAKEKPC